MFAKTHHTSSPLPNCIFRLVPISNAYNIIAAIESPTMAPNAVLIEMSDPLEVNATAGLEAAAPEEDAEDAEAADPVAVEEPCG